VTADSGLMAYISVGGKRGWEMGTSKCQEAAQRERLSAAGPFVKPDQVGAKLMLM
jgi:hypothetical protein